MIFEKPVPEDPDHRGCSTQPSRSWQHKTGMADLTCKANSNKEKCQGKDNTIIHRNTGIDF